MKAFLKNNAAALSGGLCLLLILCAAAALFARRDRGTYELANLRGDEALLKSLVLPMTLSDGTHTQALLLQNGALTHTFRSRRIFSAETRAEGGVYAFFVPAPDSVSVFETHTPAQSEEKGVAAPSLGRRVDRVRITMDVDRTARRTGLMGRLKSPEYQIVHILTDLTCAEPVEFLYTAEDSEADELGGPCYYPAGYTENAPLARANLDKINLTAELAGRVYALTPTLPAYEGRAAVYRVEDWHNARFTLGYETLGGYRLLDMLQSYPRGKATPVLSFPAAGVRTLRLDAVAGKLCVLLIQNGRLLLRAYTPEGALLSTAELGPYEADDAVDTEMRATEGGRIVSYRLRRRVAAGNTQGAEQEYASEHALYAVELATGRLLSALPDAQARNVIDFGFAGGRWVQYMRVAVRFANNYVCELDARVRVLDAEGGELCACDILTDGWQDALAYAQGSESWAGGQPVMLQKRRELAMDMSELGWR